MIRKKYSGASFKLRVVSSGMRSALASTILLGLAACSGASIKQLNGELPKDLPQDMQKRFEIKDTVMAEPSPVPSAVPKDPFAKSDQRKTPTKKSLKKNHKKSKAAEAIAVSEAVTPGPEHPPGSSGKSRDIPIPAPSSAASGTPTLKSATVYPSRRPPKETMYLGETLTFDINYFGVAAGEVTLKVMPYVFINDRKVYHIQGNAVSSKVFSLFYRLNDSLETFIDYDGLFSHRFHILLDETKQQRDSLELYDSEKLQAFYWNRWDRKDKPHVEIKDFFPMPQFPQDSLSALYYLRTLPLKDGETYVFPVASEGKSWDAVVKVVRHEMMETPLGKVRTIVLKPEAKYQGILQKKGDSFVWLTDDDRRYPVHLEAKVRIGTVVADLKKIEPGEPPR
ncbi:MAG: DUF3108 domain-containing protein [Methylotenera sp.]|nr:DUF3108 domain-containing protein [Oligoflexia bacterium]